MSSGGQDPPIMRTRICNLLNIKAPILQGGMLSVMCDIVIENFSPRVMANWDLQYETFKNANPGIIMLSMSGMGRTAPWRDFVAYGQTVQALGGLTHLTGLASESPVGIDYAFADPISGLYALVAILTALADRDFTGRGTYIDLSEYEAVCSFVGPALITAQTQDAEPGSLGNDDNEMVSVLQGCYPCRDRDDLCVLSIRDEHQWRAFCGLIDRSDWLTDKRFETMLYRCGHRQEVDRGIQAWTPSRSSEEIVDLLNRAGVSASLVYKSGNLINNPQLRHRNFFRTISFPDAKIEMVDESPIRSTGAYRESWYPSPEQGQDNRYVFLEMMGLPESLYNQYWQKGVIA